jgi:hypothetical protein
MAKGPGRVPRPLRLPFPGGVVPASVDEEPPRMSGHAARISGPGVGVAGALSISA